MITNTVLETLGKMHRPSGWDIGLWIKETTVKSDCRGGH